MSYILCNNYQVFSLGTYLIIIVHWIIDSAMGLYRYLTTAAFDQTFILLFSHTFGH